MAIVAAVTPGQIVAKMNAQHVANGIPGGITLNAQWTTGCMHHVRYEELNGIPWTHQETPGKPGFTKDGQLTGAGGDQSYTSGWEYGNPFENLPLHSVGPWQFAGSFDLTAATVTGPGGRSRSASSTRRRIRRSSPTSRPAPSSSFRSRRCAHTRATRRR